MPLRRLKKIFTGQGVSQTSGSVYPVILPKIDLEPDEAQIMYTRNVGIAASYYLFH